MALNLGRLLQCLKVWTLLLSPAAGRPDTSRPTFTAIELAAKGSTRTGAECRSTELAHASIKALIAGMQWFQ